MIKPLEQTSYIMLNDKEIMFIVGSSNVGKSTYLATIQTLQRAKVK